MSLFARLVSGSWEFRDLDPIYLSTLQQAKRAQWLAYSVDAQPVPNATQVVVNAGIVADATTARQTWVLRDMTADEIEAAALEAEKTQIADYLTDIQTQLDISNATRGAMTTNQRFNALEADTRVLLKSAKFILRRIKRSG